MSFLYSRSTSNQIDGRMEYIFQDGDAITTSQLPKWVTSSNHYNSDSRNNNRSFCDSFKPHVSFVFLFWEQLKMEVQICCKHLMQM